MQVNLSQKIGEVLAGGAKTETNHRFYEKYHESFLLSGQHKGEAVLRQIDSLANKPELKNLAYVSLGGSEGSELEYVLKNSDISRGVLLEIDTYACQAAKLKMASLDECKEFVVLPGDILQQIQPLQDLLKAWKDEGKIEGVLFAANAVFHELPSRSKGFNLNSFLSEIFWDWNPCLFVTREPCEPFNWPEQVEFSVKGVSSSLLYSLTEKIKFKLDFDGDIHRCGPEYVSAPRALVAETIHKLFYLNDFDYEIQEKITSIQPDNFVSMVEKHLGKNSAFQVRLNSSSFSRKYQEFEISARSEDGVSLTMPLSFFSVVASRI